MMFELLIQELSALPQIEAIALGGSRAGNCFDEKSDYDVYLYCTASIPEETRREILEKYCSYMEIGNSFWELEDNCTLRTGTDMDILYRNLDDFCGGLSYVVEQCQPYNGYTTCMWHNLLTCKILYDREGRLAAAKARFQVPYPQELKRNIIHRGWKLLHEAMPAYELQIAKAIDRGDLVSVNHRVAAFMESYFDVIFALNEQTHPGEKRLISLCQQNCKLLPDHFEENLNVLFGHLFGKPELVKEDLHRILQELDKIF